MHRAVQPQSNAKQLPSIATIQWQTCLDEEVRREGGNLLQADQHQVSYAAASAGFGQVVVNLSHAQHHALDGMSWQQKTVRRLMG